MGSMIVGITGIRVGKRIQFTDCAIIRVGYGIYFKFAKTSTAVKMAAEEANASIITTTTTMAANLQALCAGWCLSQRAEAKAV